MSARLREIQSRMVGTELIGAIRIPPRRRDVPARQDEIDERVIDNYVSEHAEPWTMRLPAPVAGDACEIEALTRQGGGGTMGPVGSGDDLGQVPAGYKWCGHCNGYGPH